MEEDIEEIEDRKPLALYTEEGEKNHMTSEKWARVLEEIGVPEGMEEEEKQKHIC